MCVCMNGYEWLLCVYVNNLWVDMHENYMLLELYEKYGWVWLLTWPCLWWFMWSLWLWQVMNDVCSMRTLWVILLYMIMYSWLRTWKRTCTEMDMHLCIALHEIKKGLSTVYSSHCDYDTERYYGLSVAGIIPGQDPWLPGIIPGHDHRLHRRNSGSTE